MLQGRLADKCIFDYVVGTCRPVPTHMLVVRELELPDLDYQWMTAVIETQETANLQGDCGPVGYCLGTEPRGSFGIYV